jgi:hypothetical protein
MSIFYHILSTPWWLYIYITWMIMDVDDDGCVWEWCAPLEPIDKFGGEHDCLSSTFVFLIFQTNHFQQSLSLLFQI